MSPCHHARLEPPQPAVSSFVSLDIKKICDFGTVLYPLLLSIKFCTICADFYSQADGISEFWSFVGTRTLYVLGLTLELLLNSYTTLKFALARV